jgi:topoisomerase-4 subunit B
MDPRRRTLLRVVVDKAAERDTADLVDRLMGRNPEPRFRFIQENARFVEEIDV